MFTKKHHFSLVIRSMVIVFWIFFIFFIIFWLSFPREIKNTKNSLNIFSWSGIIHPSVIEEFQKKHKIKVNIDYFSSNEELLIKLKATKGLGYDIIMQSDYATEILIKENLLKPIDKSKINFWSDIDPLLLGYNFDPNNTFSLPLEWDICGFGIDSESFNLNSEELTWNHLFNEKNISYRIAMSNDPVEAFCLGAYYLYGGKSSLSSDEAQEVAKLLKNQKKWVEAYAVPRSDYLLAAKNASIAVILNGFVMQAKKDFPKIKFIPPSDASFISIENVTITKSTSKDDKIYKFLNFLYEKDQLIKCSNAYGFFPASLSAEENFIFSDECKKIQQTIFDKNYKLYFFRHLLPENELRNLWIKVKS